MRILTDGHRRVVRQVRLGIEREEEVDLLLAPELGGDLSCRDGLLLDLIAVDQRGTFHVN